MIVVLFVIVAVLVARAGCASIQEHMVRTNPDASDCSKERTLERLAFGVVLAFQNISLWLS